MKVAVKDIKPNPFRHIERYPILPELVKLEEEKINNISGFSPMIMQFDRY